MRPAGLLLDASLSNLDTKLHVQIRKIITGQQNEAIITTVFVTKDPEEALPMPDLNGVMNPGGL